MSYTGKTYVIRISSLCTTTYLSLILGRTSPLTQARWSLAGMATLGSRHFSLLLRGVLIREFLYTDNNMYSRTSLVQTLWRVDTFILYKEVSWLEEIYARTATCLLQPLEEGHDGQCTRLSCIQQGSHRFWKFWKSFGISRTYFQALEKYGIWSMGLE